RRPALEGGVSAPLAVARHADPARPAVGHRRTGRQAPAAGQPGGAARRPADGRRRPLTDLPHIGLYRRATAAALVSASVLFLVDNIIHPTEYERGNEARQLAQIGAHADRWQLAHALGFLSILVFTAA